MPDTGWGRLELADMALTLEVPDARGWRAGGGRDWLRLVHGQSDSTLEVRRFRASPRVRPSECAVEAGLAIASDPAEAGSIERRSLLTAGELRIDLGVALEPLSLERPHERDQGGGLAGSVEAAAAGFRVCVAVRFRTTVQGAGSEAEIARRLGVFADRVVPSLTLVSIEDRVGAPGDPGPSSP
jgi:hypothetical protein